MIEVDFNKDAGPATLGERVTYFCLMGVMVVAFTGEILTNYEPMKLTVVFFLLAWIPLTVVHELGHAVVARAVGWEVEEFVIGYGKVLREFEFRGTRVELRMVPLAGYVRPRYEEGDWSRGKGALVYFAGPGVELVIFGVLYWLIGVGTFMEPSEDYLRILMQGVG